MSGDGEPFGGWHEYVAALLRHANEDRGAPSVGAFLAELDARMAQGRRDYGDQSFRLPAGIICDEWAEEALDVAGWGFVEWTKVGHDAELSRDVLRAAAMGIDLWKQIRSVQARMRGAK